MSGMSTDVSQAALTKKRVTHLLARISPCPNTGCWFWTGAERGGGYGTASLENRARPAHWLVYAALRGPVPKDHELDHLCRVRPCCNPDHLEPVTHKENMRRSPVAGIARATQQSTKTHCPKGHPYSGDNLMVFEGRAWQKPRAQNRICRICHRNTGREAQRRYRARQKALRLRAVR